jgi:hypothetical protein
MAEKIALLERMAKTLAHLRIFPAAQVKRFKSWRGVTFPVIGT